MPAGGHRDSENPGLGGVAPPRGSRRVSRLAGVGRVWSAVLAPGSEAELRLKIAAMAGPTPSSEFTFVIEVSGAVTGECSVHAIDYRNRVAQIGICIWRPEERRGGIGSEVLRQLVEWSTGYRGLRRLEAWITAENEPSCKMVERQGFVREGTLRQRYQAGGAWHDIHLFGLLAE